MEQYLAAHPDFLEFIGSLHDGGAHPPEGVLPTALRGPGLGDLRMKLALTMGVPPYAGAGLNASCFAGFRKVAGDPDDDLEEWITTGAPLGVRHQLHASGIFPFLDEAPPPRTRT